jgi:hypothetical protein
LCKDMKTGNVHFVGWSWALRCNDMNLRFHLRICSFAIVHVLSIYRNLADIWFSVKKAKIVLFIRSIEFLK